MSFTSLVFEFTSFSFGFSCGTDEISDGAAGLTVPDIDGSGNGDASPQLMLNGNANRNGYVFLCCGAGVIAGAKTSDNISFFSRPPTPASPPLPQLGKLDPAFELNLDSGKGSGIGEPLFDEEDPFVRVDGVKVVAGAPDAAKFDAAQSLPTTVMEVQDQDKNKGEKVEKKDAKDKETKEDRDKRREKRKEKERKKSKSKEPSKGKSKSKESKGSTSAPQVQVSSSEDPTGGAGGEGQDTMETNGAIEDKNETLPTPRSPENRYSRVFEFSQLMSPPPPLIADMVARVAEKEKLRVNTRGPYMLTDFVSDPEFLQMLLEYLGFYDWCLLASVSRMIRIAMVQKREVREEILERFLRPVGYQRWDWEEAEPLSLSLQVSKILEMCGRWKLTGFV